MQPIRFARSSAGVSRTINVEVYVPTLTTVPLIVLLIWLWSRTGHRILPAVAFVSVYTAASSINIGSVGLTCWVFTLVSFGVARRIFGSQRYRVTPGINRSAMIAVSVFVFYAAISGLVFPFLFAGVPVVRVAHAQPLEWGMGNVAQLSYLVASFSLYLVAIGRPKAQLDEALTWYIRACVVASVIAFYQLLNATTHLPYPSDVLYSNPSFVIFPAYQIGGMWRLNGPFTEASDMAGFMMLGISLQGWILMHRPLTLARVLSFAIMVAALLMTQSSTGYLTVGAVVIVGVFVYLRYLWRGGAFSQVKMILAILLIAVLGVACLNTAVINTVEKVVTATVLEKQNSDSYRDRTMTHVTAMQTLADTWYVGAGWGSARASGLIFALFANTGVLGVVLFGVMLFSFTLPLYKGSARRRVVDQSSSDANEFSLGAILFGMGALLFTLMVAGSELGTPMLWILFAAATVSTATDPNPSQTYLGEDNRQDVIGQRQRMFA